MLRRVPIEQGRHGPATPGTTKPGRQHSRRPGASRSAPPSQRAGCTRRRGRLSGKGGRDFGATDPGRPGSYSRSTGLWQAGIHHYPPVGVPPYLSEPTLKTWIWPLTCVIARQLQWCSVGDSSAPAWRRPRAHCVALSSRGICVFQVLSPVRVVVGHTERWRGQEYVLMIMLPASYLLATGAQA